MSRTTKLLAVLLTALAPATSSALALAKPLPLAADASDPETRVRGINLAAGDCVWLSSPGTPGSHQGICLCAAQIASDRTYAANNPLRYVDPTGLAIVINNTGDVVIVSGNVGSGHGTGGQAFGTVPAGAIGGGVANPVVAYATREEALQAILDPSFAAKPVGSITDVDYYDSLPATTCRPHRSSVEADVKVIGDEKGPTFGLDLKTGGIEHTVISGRAGAYIRRGLEWLGF